MSGLAEVLMALRPGAEFAVRGEEIDGIEWLDAAQPRPTDAEIARAAARQASDVLDQHLTVAISEMSSLAPKGKSAMTSPSASGLNVKQLMEEHVRVMGEIHQTQIALLKTSLAKQRETVAAAVSTVAKSVDDQTAEFMSIMGQFTNDFGVD